MKLVFLGTAAFAVPSLRACAVRHSVVAVVAQPERRGHRRAPAPRPVADAARELGIPVLAPERIREPGAVEAVLAAEPDCLVVAAYGQILPPPLLERPRWGAVNVHASLLPRWRGASPVAHAILAGDRETGVSIMRMDAGLDTGPVYRRCRVAIDPEATTPSLTDTLAGTGAVALLEVLAELERGDAVAVAQPADGVTHAPRLTREDGRIDWKARSGVDVDRRVRALQPWPGAVAPVAGVPVHLLAGAPVALAGDAAPGDVAQRDGESVVVATRDGGYRIDSLRPPGSRAMSAAAFLRGLHGSGS